jgi:hypothetical protein
MNVRGTAPGKVKWSYFGCKIGIFRRLREWPFQARKSACDISNISKREQNRNHVRQSIVKNTIEEHVMRSMHVIMTLKLSSTFVYGARRTWVHDVSRIRTSCAMLELRVRCNCLRTLACIVTVTNRDEL